MNTRQITIPSSIFPDRPERPFKYVHPITAPDGRVGYDHPLENYFDPTMATRLLPSKPLSRLYDTVARAHDHRFGISPDMVDPSCTNPRPLILNTLERRRSLAKLDGNSVDYVGISPDQPDWRFRRSPYGDICSTVGVAPNQVNVLVPHIPPIDTSLPPPSREWLQDARSRKLLTDARVGFEGSQHFANNDVTMYLEHSLASDDSTFFEYDTDSTCDVPVTTLRRVLVPQPPQRPHQTEAEPITRDYDHGWSSDSDSDTDMDIDMHDGIPPCTPLTGPWIIPRKRPSVVVVNGREVARDAGPLSPEDAQPGLRERRGMETRSSRRVTKKPERYANDTPMRQDGSKTVPGYHHHHVLDSEAGGSPERAHCCLACGKSYTRPDALKRHLKSKASCKKVHAAKQLENERWSSGRRTDGSKQ